MNKEELKKILPHRDSMLLIDEAYCKDDISYGSVKIRGDEWFLDGHFPKNPVVPGVILCEMLAQSACVLLSDTIGEGQLPFFTGLDKVRFKNPVKPGDTLKTECEIIKHKMNFYFAKGRGYVDAKLCVEAEFSFAIAPDKKE